MGIRHGVLTEDDGAFLPIRLTLTRAGAATLRKAGGSVPAPLDITALIDTGAQVSCIDPTVALTLGLPLKNMSTINMPATGGLSFTWTYFVNLTIPGPPADPGAELLIEELEVLEADLNVRGCQALIGRDVLSRCVLLYDGVSNTFTLSY